MAYQVGELIQGTITKIVSYGAFMVFEDETPGLLHISEVANTYIRNLYHYLHVGAIYLVKVIAVDEEKNFLKVSLKQVSQEERDNNKAVINERIKNQIDFSKLKEELPKFINQTLNEMNNNHIEPNKEEKNMVNVNLNHLVDKVDFVSYTDKVKTIHQGIHNKSLAGNDFLGWLNYPNTYDQNELAVMAEKAKYVRDNFDVLVVCGIGGSYLGALAAINALKGLYPNDKLKIIFMGQTFSSTYIAQVMDYLKDKKFAINVISKSGTTTETSISFRLLKQLLESKVGKVEAAKAIFATTDKEKGALKQLATKEGYTTFVLPGDIGGRYSVLTAVGLFPIACAGVDIRAMLEGAKEAMNKYNNEDINSNPCYQYAVVRDYMYHHNKQCEMFITYEPHLREIAEWLKQLFGESEGKGHKGLLPTSATFSTDLHSLGQFIQDGSPVLFETILNIKKPMLDITVPHDDEDLDGLNYIENKSLSFVNEKAFLGTLEAHEKDGKVNNVVLEIEKLDAYTLGYVFYFFMKACAMSAYLLEINPFDQPGVEIYKKNMFHLLGKKGY